MCQMMPYIKASLGSGWYDTIYDVPILETFHKGFFLEKKREVLDISLEFRQLSIAIQLFRFRISTYLK